MRKIEENVKPENPIMQEIDRAADELYAKLTDMCENGGCEAIEFGLHVIASTIIQTANGRKIQNLVAGGGTEEGAVIALKGAIRNKKFSDKLKRALLENMIDGMTDESDDDVEKAQCANTDIKAQA